MQEQLGFRSGWAHFMCWQHGCGHRVCPVCSSAGVSVQLSYATYVGSVLLSVAYVSACLSLCVWDWTAGRAKQPLMLLLS